MATNFFIIIYPTNDQIIAQDADEARELAELQALYKSQQEEVEELRQAILLGCMNPRQGRQ